MPPFKPKLKPKNQSTLPSCTSSVCVRSTITMWLLGFVAILPWFFGPVRICGITFLIRWAFALVSFFRFALTFHDWNYLN